MHWKPRQYGCNELWFLVYFRVFRQAFQPMRQVGSEPGSEVLREKVNKLKAFVRINLLRQRAANPGLIWQALQD